MIHNMNLLPEGFRDSLQQILPLDFHFPTFGIRSASGEQWTSVGYTLDQEYALLIARAVHRDTGCILEVWLLDARPQRLHRIPQ